MADNIIRRSPVAFDSTPAQTEVRDNWTVVLEYEGQGDGPWVIDLSHRVRWDLQDREIDAIQPWALNIPDTPGRCIYEKGILINRMNRTQSSIWHLSGEKPDSLDGTAYTDVTDATLFLALIGKNLASITEKLTSLDFFNPLNDPPFLLQGPLSHVPCQCVMLERSPERSAILFTCSRGYARDMVHAVLDAGAEFGLKPAGETSFHQWLKELSIGS
ncbi:MAG: sarcosine oxidase subunit gamma SoxG [Deltaproteobacteria bacterium]|nr:sarcosine oxidase subunit gamma SoxG [Deltaproteobacteria bacterium]